jgi:hypothetical protein
LRDEGEMPRCGSKGVVVVVVVVFVVIVIIVVVERAGAVAGCFDAPELDFMT